MIYKFRKRRVAIFLLASIFFIYLFRTTLRLAGRDFLYLTRPIWDDEGNVPGIIIPHFYAPTVDPEDLCSLHGWSPRPKSSSPVRIVDAFLFSVELDMLEIRLKELWDVVDIFLVVEANKTFTGRGKPLTFNETKDRFSWAEKKIVHHIVTGLSSSPESEFQNESFMRRTMGKLIRDLNLQEGDLVIAGDVDELPYAHTIKLLRSCDGFPAELHLEMQNYLYSFEFRLQTSNWKPHVTTYFNPSAFAYHHGLRKSKHRLADAGWHCSFCFRKISDFIFKMTSYSHTDRVTRQILLDPNEIQKKICQGSDIFDMLPEAYTFQDLIAQFGNVHKTMSTVGIPNYIVENSNKFRYLLPGGCVREDINTTFSSSHQ